MSLRCPNCFSGRIERLDNGRRIGGCLGSVVGAGATIASVMKGAEVGMELLDSPVGAVAGGAVGGICSLIVAGTLTGASAGVVIGGVVDDHVLDNYYCLSCHHHFSEASGHNQPEGLP